MSLGPQYKHCEHGGYCFIVCPGCENNENDWMWKVNYNVKSSLEDKPVVRKYNNGDLVRQKNNATLFVVREDLGNRVEVVPQELFEQRFNSIYAYIDKSDCIALDKNGVPLDENDFEKMHRLTKNLSNEEFQWLCDYILKNVKI